MANNIKISIVSALNSAGIEATKKQVDQMTKSVNGSLSDLAKNNKTHMADIKAGWDMACAAIKKAWEGVTAALKEAFKFETTTTQFKTLIGNIDDAKRHMKDLKDLGDTPPFSLDEFAKASRQLMVMTDGVLGYKESLKLVGDAAAATGVPLETMGHAVGRLYAFIRDDQPLSRAVMELRNMGVITPEVAQSLQDLQTAGASSAEIWGEVEKQLSRYNGAMEATEKTGDGMIGAIQSRWQNIVRAFGTAFEDTAKGGLQNLIDKMKELEEDGTLEVWAAKVGAAMKTAVEKFSEAKDACTAIGTALQWLYERSGLSDAVHGVNSIIKGTASGIGAAIGGGSFGEAYDQASMEEIVKGYYGNLAAKSGMLGEAFQKTAEIEEEVQQQEKAHIEEIRERAVAERAAKEQVEETVRAEAERQRIAEDLDKKRMERLQKEYEEREKQLEKEREEGDKLWAEVLKEDLADANKSLSEARKEEATAASEVKAAEEKLKKAIETYEANIAQNMTNEVVTAAAQNAVATHGLQNGHSEYLKHVGEIGNAAGQVAVSKALADGKIRTVAAYDKLFNSSARDARAASNRQAAEEGRDAQRAARLSQMSQKAMSKADKDWLDKYNKVNAANKKQKEDIQKAQQEEAAAKKKLQDALQAAIDAKKKIDSIDQRLETLGLK